MRIRTVKPELFTSAVVSSWPRDVRWTLAGLYCYLDDHGYGEDDPRLIVAAVYPRDDQMTAKKLEAHLALMAISTGPLCRFEADNGTKLMHVIEWKVKGSDYFQQINKPSKSRIEPCPKHEAPTLFT